MTAFVQELLQYLLTQCTCNNDGSRIQVPLEKIMTAPSLYSKWGGIKSKKVFCIPFFQSISSVASFFHLN